MTSASVSALHQAAAGTGYPKPQTPAFPVPVPITVQAGGDVNGVKFTVDSLSSGWAFGPAPYPSPASSAQLIPPGGTKGIAMFAQNSELCWILCLYNWPTPEQLWAVLSPLDIDP